MDCLLMSVAPAQAKVACGFGHNSWVSSVTFDPHYKKGDVSCHRLVSVGLDGCLVLWDLNTAIACVAAP